MADRILQLLGERPGHSPAGMIAGLIVGGRQHNQNPLEIAGHIIAAIADMLRPAANVEGTTMKWEIRIERGRDSSDLNWPRRAASEGWEPFGFSAVDRGAGQGLEYVVAFRRPLVEPPPCQHDWADNNRCKLCGEFKR